MWWIRGCRGVVALILSKTSPQGSALPWPNIIAFGVDAVTVPGAAAVVEPGPVSGRACGQAAHPAAQAGADDLWGSARHSEVHWFSYFRFCGPLESYFAGPGNSAISPRPDPEPSSVSERPPPGCCEILPLALGIAISPVPIIAVILMLFSAPRGPK